MSSHLLVALLLVSSCLDQATQLNLSCFPYPSEVGWWLSVNVFEDNFFVVTTDHRLYSFRVAPASNRYVPFVVDMSRPLTNTSIGSVVEGNTLATFSFANMSSACPPVPMVAMFIRTSSNYEIFTVDYSERNGHFDDFKVRGVFKKYISVVNNMDLAKDYIMLAYELLTPDASCASIENQLTYLEFDDENFAIVQSKSSVSIPIQMNLKRLQSCVIVFSGDLSYVFLSKTYEDLQSNAETSSYRKTNFRRGKVSAFLHRPSWDGAGEHVYIFNHDDDQLYSFKLLSLDRTVQRTRLRKIETKYCVYCNVLPTMPSTSSAHIVLDDDKTFAERTTLPMLPVKMITTIVVLVSFLGVLIYLFHRNIHSGQIASTSISKVVESKTDFTTT